MKHTKLEPRKAEKRKWYFKGFNVNQFVGDNPIELGKGEKADPKLDKAQMPNPKTQRSQDRQQKNEVRALLLNASCMYTNWEICLLGLAMCNRVSRMLVVFQHLRLGQPQIQNAF